MASNYPRSPNSIKRPFRLWDAKEKAAMRWRYYAGPHNAHQGALLETRWAAVGSCIEVYDARTGKLLGQYKRRQHTIDFTGE